MPERTKSASPNVVDCEIHGTCTSAIVCRHHVQTASARVGFVETCDDPDDLQAWCDECEALFIAEGDKTEAFRAFNDFAVVCGECYRRIKALHSG